MQRTREMGTEKRYLEAEHHSLGGDAHTQGETLVLILFLGDKLCDSQSCHSITSEPLSHPFPCDLGQDCRPQLWVQPSVWQLAWLSTFSPCD